MLNIEGTHFQFLNFLIREPIKQQYQLTNQNFIYYFFFSIPKMSNTPPKRDFLGKPAPLGYIAGLGRGARGFTTRSDLGSGFSLDESKSVTAAQVQLAKEQLRQESHLSSLKEEEGLLSTTNNKEDKEADAFFENLDKIMSSRRKQKEKKTIIPIEHSTTSLFAEEKAALATVDWNAWNAIPDGGDHLTKLAQTKRQKRMDPHSRGERYSAVPDSFLQAGLSSYDGGGNNDSSSNGGAMMSRLDALIRESENNENDSAAAAINKLSAASTKHTISSFSKEKEMKSLLRAAVRTNPLSEDAWLAAIRFERQRGKLKDAATRLLSEALLRLPDSPNLWLEAVEVTLLTQGPIEALSILKDGIARIPSSEKLSLRLAEMDPGNRRHTLQSFLQHNPFSPTMWKEYLAAMESNGTSDTLLLPVLNAALERCPHEGDLWIKKARLLSKEAATVKEAQDALNAGRSNCPQMVEIWLEAFRLEERIASVASVAADNTSSSSPPLSSSSSSLPNKDLLLKMAIKAINTLPKNVDWLNEAKECPPVTQRMIIKAMLKEGLIKGAADLIDASLKYHTHPQLQYNILLEYLAENPADQTVHLKALQLASKNNLPGLDSLITTAMHNLPGNFDVWKLVLQQRKHLLPEAIKLFEKDQVIMLLNDYCLCNQEYSFDFYEIIKKFLTGSTRDSGHDYLWLRYVRDSYILHHSQAHPSIDEVLQSLPAPEGGIISLIRLRLFGQPIRRGSRISIPANIVLSLALPTIGAARALLESSAKIFSLLSHGHSHGYGDDGYERRIFWSPCFIDQCLFGDSDGRERGADLMWCILTLFRLLLEVRGTSSFTALLEEGCQSGGANADIFIYERIFSHQSSGASAVLKSKGKAAPLLKVSSPLYHTALGRLSGDVEEFRKGMKMVLEHLSGTDDGGHRAVNIDVVAYYFLNNSCDPNEMDCFLARKDLYFIGGLQWISFLKDCLGGIGGGLCGCGVSDCLCECVGCVGYGNCDDGLNDRNGNGNNAINNNFINSKAINTNGISSGVYSRKRAQITNTKDLLLRYMERLE